MTLPTWQNKSFFAFSYNKKKEEEKMK
jgi:hypothetical protein